MDRTPGLRRQGGAGGAKCHDCARADVQGVEGPAGAEVERAAAAVDGGIALRPGKIPGASACLDDADGISDSHIGDHGAERGVLPRAAGQGHGRYSRLRRGLQNIGCLDRRPACLISPILNHASRNVGRKDDAHPAIVRPGIPIGGESESEVSLLPEAKTIRARAEMGLRATVSRRIKQAAIHGRARTESQERGAISRASPGRLKGRAASHGESAEEWVDVPAGEFRGTRHPVIYIQIDPVEIRGNRDILQAMIDDRRAGERRRAVKHQRCGKPDEPRLHGPVTMTRKNRAFCPLMKSG